MASTRPASVEMTEYMDSAVVDSDLDELLSGVKADYSAETPLLNNLDHLHQGNVPRRQAQLHGMSMTDVMSGNCSCFQYPTVCVCLASPFILWFVVILINATLNPMEEFGVIKHDFSNIGVNEPDFSLIRSEFDLMMGKIDHWCLNGGNECMCEDPLTPQSRSKYEAWVDVHKRNKRQIVAYKDSDLLDVAFLGESLVEEMDGRWLGRDDSDELKAIGKVFAKRFNKPKHPENMQGVALGIAGDTAPNVLWRIMHGEMPRYFNPRVWWISLGMNDLGRSQCSEEVALIGILRVVEQIRMERPDALIVINSLLPMTELRGGIFPLMTDYRDAFREGRGYKPMPVGSSRYVPSSQIAPSKTNQEGATGKDVEKLKGNTREVDRHPFNPRLPYQNKMRNKKLDAHNPFLQKNRLPLWTSINEINEELKEYCAKHERITFFDSTDIFAERAEGGQYMLLSDIISARGHPTVAGFEKWEDAVVEYLKKLLPKIEKD